MKTDTILNNFVAGELSPRLAGRNDITQYYQSAAEILNMIVEFYGGAKKTPGTYFVNEVKTSSLATRIIRFVFSDTQAYIIELGNLYIRFYMDDATTGKGGAILETGIAITGATQNAECTITAANSYTNGDEVYISGVVGMTELNERRFLVSDRTAANFKIKDIDGNYIDSTGYTAWGAGGTQRSARVYTLTTTYTTADLWNLQFSQTADILYITLGKSTDAANGRPQKKLTRTAHTIWTLTDIDYSTDPARMALMPANESDLTILPSALGLDFDPTTSYTVGQYVKVGNYISLNCGGAKRLFVSAPYGTNTTGKTVAVEIAGGDALAVTYTAGAILISLANATPAKNAANLIQVALRASSALINNWYVTENAAYAAARPTAGVALGATALTDCDKGYLCILDAAGNATNTALFPPIETTYWSEQTGIAITLTASAALFDLSTPSKHIGSIWKIASAKSVSTTAWAPATVYVAGAYIIYDDEIYFAIDAHTSGSSFSVDLDAGHWSLQTFYVKIVSVSDSTHAIGNILYDSILENSPVATANWSEGAWSAYRGYPKSVTINEGRLEYGYTVSQPQTTWGSAIGAYEVFELGSDDADAIEFTADTNQVEVINWLFPANEILVGTPSGVSALGTGSDTLALAADTGRMKKKVSYGASSILPQIIGNFVFYWQKYNRILREYGISADTLDYEAKDATAFADHISEGGIVDMAYQQSPLNILWCVRTDGKLAVFTRQIEQKVSAWTLHDTQGFYESVAVIPKESYDEVWFVVRRTINGVTRRYIEYMVAPEFDDQEDAFFVHSGLTLDVPYAITGITATNPPVVSCVNSLADGDIIKIRGVLGMTEVNYKKFIVANRAAGSFTLQDLDSVDIDATAYTTYISGGEARECVSTISGLDHLEGKTVQVLADGASHPDRVVTSGAITLDDTYSQVTAGLGYTARLKTNDLEPAPGRISAQGKIKRVANVLINLLESLGCKVGTALQMDEVIFRTSAMPTDQAPSLFTGIKEVPFPSGWDREKQVIISQEQPLPLHIRSIILEMETS